MTMKFDKVVLRIIDMPLKKPFVTHLATVKTRKSIIVQVVDEDGCSGYGEVVAFDSPWYTEETVQTAYHMLKDYLIPLVFANQIEHPAQVTTIFSAIKGNPMAKAGLETAIWDLYAKRCQQPLAQVIGGTREKVAAGAVVATKNMQDAIKQIERFLEQGYQRVKLKINQQMDYQYLKEIRSHFPTLPLMVDANSSYTLKDIEKLQALDQFDLLMIEQPLGTSDIVDHAYLQSQLKTPICLDESITSFHDAQSAIQLGSCQVINIKIGRVGGLQTAIAIHDLCISNQVKLWCGGMIEYGISKAHNLALSSLTGFSIPGDLPASTNYWEEDIIEPEINIDQGYIQVPTKDGIGFSINQRRLTEVTSYVETFVGGES